MSTPVIFTITPAGLDAAEAHSGVGLSPLQLVSISAHLADGTEWGRFDLSGGIIEPTTHTARFSAILKSITSKSAYQLKLWTSDSVIFAQAISASPLVVVAANIDFAASFGLALTGVPAGSVTISINPDDSVAQALMMQHVGAANPHPQYLTRATAAIYGIDHNLSLSPNSAGGMDLDDKIYAGKFWTGSTTTSMPPSEYEGVMTVDVADGTPTSAYYFAWQHFQGKNGIYTRWYRSTAPDVAEGGVWSSWLKSVNSGDYPKIIAAGSGNMDIVSTGSAFHGSKTVSLPAPIDLNNRGKYLLYPTIHGSGIGTNAAKFNSWSCDESAGNSFTIGQIIGNNDDDNYAAGSFYFTWHVLQTIA